MEEKLGLHKLTQAKGLVQLKWNFLKKINYKCALNFFGRNYS